MVGPSITSSNTTVPTVLLTVAPNLFITDPIALVVATCTADAAAACAARAAGVLAPGPAFDNCDGGDRDCKDAAFRTDCVTPRASYTHCTGRNLLSPSSSPSPGGPAPGGSLPLAGSLSIADDLLLLLLLSFFWL